MAWRKAAPKFSSVASVDVDGTRIAGYEVPPRGEAFPGWLDAHDSSAAVAAFRRGSTGMVSLAFADGGRRDLAFDLAGFASAIEAAKRFHAEMVRDWEADLCQGMWD
jgi:hypothetical protein